MGQTKSIRLPFPPTINTYWRSIVVKGRVRVLLSAKGRKYQADVHEKVLRAFGLCQPIEGRLRVEVKVNPPDKRTRDLDNLAKSILDGLANASVFVNDSQIDQLELSRTNEIGSPGSVDVLITELD